MAIYNFCPKCGSVTKAGVCDSCGFVAPDYEPESTNTQSSTSNLFTDAISANSGVFSSSSTDDSMFAPKEGAVKDGQSIVSETSTESLEDAPANSVNEAVSCDQTDTPVQNNAASDSITNIFSGAAPLVTPAESTVIPQSQPQIQPQIQPQVQSQPQYQAQTNTQPQTNAQTVNQQYYSQNGYANQAYNAAYPNGYYSVPVRKKKSLSTGAIVGIVVGSVLLFFALCAGIIFAVYSLARSGMQMISSDVSHYIDTYNSANSFSIDPYSDLEGDEYDLRFGTLSYPLSEVIVENEDVLCNGNYETLSDDPYEKDQTYYDFDSYYDESVPYKVSETLWYYSNKDGEYDSDDAILPHDIEIVCHYFVLSDTGLPNEDELNKEIYKASAKIADLAEDSLFYTSDSYSIYAENRAYITYMDENVLSIAFYPTAYQQSDYDDAGYSLESYLNSINIDMTTGRVLKATEEFDFSGDFYKTFQDKCYTQNGVAINYYTDEELMDIFETDDVFWVYTPIGLEVGINRPSYMGWSTCTFLDYSDLIKTY